MSIGRRVRWLCALAALGGCGDQSVGAMVSGDADLTEGSRIREEMLLDYAYGVMACSNVETDDGADVSPGMNELPSTTKCLQAAMDRHIVPLLGEKGRALRLLSSQCLSVLNVKVDARCYARVEWAAVAAVDLVFLKLEIPAVELLNASLYGEAPGPPVECASGEASCIRAALQREIGDAMSSDPYVGDPALGSMEQVARWEFDYNSRQLSDVCAVLTQAAGNTEQLSECASMLERRRYDLYQAFIL